MSYYRIDWDALNALSPAEKMAALSRINTDIRHVTGAERNRMAHRAVAKHGSQRAAADALGMKPARFNQIYKESPMTVTITPCTEPAELHRHYPGQTEPQDCFIALDIRDGHMWADYNPEVGNGVPADVWHGLVRRYDIPPLTAQAANRVMEEIRPLAERIFTDSEEVWDGSNHVARLGDDAVAAEEEILARFGEDPEDRQDAWDPADLVSVWDIDGATNGGEAEEYGITAATTDERLAEIEEQIRHDLAGISDSDVVVLDGVDDYLEQLRDDQRLASTDPMDWAQALDEAQEAADCAPGELAATAVEGWLAGVELAAAQPGPDAQGQVRIAAAHGWTMVYDADEGWLPEDDA